MKILIHKDTYNTSSFNETFNWTNGCEVTRRPKVAITTRENNIKLLVSNKVCLAT